MPLTGTLDVRSMPELMTPTQFRFRQNFDSPDDGKVCRLGGFEKLLTQGSNYGNMDLHDQLLPLQFYYDEQNPPISGSGDITSWPDGAYCETVLNTRANVREPINFGFQFTGDDGERKFLVGTQSRLYLANLNTRNWRILGDGLGGPYSPSMQVRWTAAALKNKIFFTNDYDIPLYWEVGSTPSGCAMRSVKQIPDAILIGLQRAAVVVQFSNCIHFMNVTLDGERFSNRIISSDLNDGTSLDPANADSIAAYTDLPDSDGETILTAAPLGSDLIVYTTGGIYVGSATGDPDNPFSYRKHYEAEDTGNRCLRYPFTLVNNGSTHIYGGADGIYTFTPYRRDPVKTDWIWNASGVPYLGITSYPKLRADYCNVHTAGFDALTKNVWFSWVAEGQTLPQRSLIINIEHNFSSLVDAGFTMFCNFTPDYRPLLRDWLNQYCACSVTELQAHGFTYVKEAQPINLCNGAPTESIWTQDTAVNYGSTTEDFAQESADEASLCAALDGKTLDSFCGECGGDGLFVAAWSNDYCLKQMGTAFVREGCDNATTGSGVLVGTAYSSFVGVYTDYGYYSVMRSAANPYGTVQLAKNVNRIFLHLKAAQQTDPCVISLRLGYSFEPRDPNLSDCGIMWSEPERRYLECPDPALDANQVPSTSIEFPFYVTGIYLYWELTIANLSDQEDLNSSLQPAKGGDACFSSVSAQARRDSSTYQL